MEALDPARYEVIPFTIDKDGKWSPRPILPEPDGNPGIDVVFPALHGTFGETARCRDCSSWPICRTSAEACWRRRLRWTRR